MNTSEMKGKLVEIKDSAKAGAEKALHGAKGFYARNGKEVRLVANTGVYVAGCVVSTVAVTTAGKAAGLAIGMLGLIGLCGSAAEYIGDGLAKPKS